MLDCECRELNQARYETSRQKVELSSASYTDIKVTAVSSRSLNRISSNVVFRIISVINL
jgi:hypothetical protein